MKLPRLGLKPAKPRRGRVDRIGLIVERRNAVKSPHVLSKQIDSVSTLHVLIQKHAGMTVLRIVIYDKIV